MLRKLFPLLILVLALGVVAACAQPTPQVIEKKVEVTKIVEKPVEKVVKETVVVEKEVKVKETVEVVKPGQTIVFWSTENQPARAERTQKIIDRFTQQTGIGVELVLVDENAIDSLMAANQAAGTMPDVVFFPLDFAATWYAQGVLDADAATDVVNTLDAGTFSEGALNMVKTEDGKYMAVPSDGWGQLLIYRKDLFDQLGLEPPTDFDKILTAAKALKDAGYIGIMAGTDPGQVFTQQCFEHFALANGVQLTDDAGNVTLDTPEMVEALRFYTELMRDYGPGDTATYWLQARATYFAGQAGMVVWSPFILDEMAGLRDSVLPNCPECKDDPAYLAKNSGVVPAFVGPSGERPAQYGQVSYMGITTNASVDAAKQFVAFWLTEGYLDWLGVAAEGKFPMRRGTPDDPEKFIKGWGQLKVGVDRKAPLSQYYSQEVLSTIVQGANNFDRWGFAQGQGELVGAIYSELPIPQAIADIIEGTMTPEEAAAELQATVEDILASLQEEK